MPTSPPAQVAAPRIPNARSGPVYRGLPGPLRLLLWSALFIFVGGLLGITAPIAVRALADTVANSPGKLAWYGVRLTGFLAYLAVAGSVVYGLMLSTKLLDRIAHRPVSFTLHRDLALVGLGFSILHGVLLLGDRTFAFTPAAILVPFASPYAPEAVGIGQLTGYLLLILVGSFYVRRQIGQRTWRLLHYLTFLAFLGVAVHGLLSGSDSGAAWALGLYLVPLAAAWFLLVYRLVLVADNRGHPRPVSLRP